VSPLLQGLIGAGLGAIIGSFLATVVSRWPRGQSVITARSRCDGCGRALNFIDLVPLLGWLIARGKCRTCGARIDPVHPLIELGCSLIGGLCAWALPPLPAGLLAVGGWLLLTLAVLDARHLWLPDALTLPFAALGLTLGEWVLPAPFPDRVVGAAAGAVLLAMLAWAYKRLRGRDGLGLGDAKLLGAIGAWLGWQALPFVLLIASVTALIWALALRLRGRTIDAETRIPLGTFLCLAVVPAWILTSALIA
jgi:leader peptidase (prepilin peptidase) / N-methyltransferase